MPSSALQILSSKLNALEDGLRNLPSSIPDASHNPLYDFRGYTISPDSDDVADFGLEGAFNRQLEIMFAPGGRTNSSCPFVIKERGPGLTAIVAVFRQVLGHLLAPSVILEKWVDDFLKVVQYYKKIGGTDIQAQALREDPESDWEDDNNNSDKDEVEVIASPPGKRQKKNTKARGGQKQPSSKATKKAKPTIGSVWDDYEEASEHESAVVQPGQKQRGRKKNGLLHELALPCRPKGGGGWMTRCVGMRPRDDGRPGCDHTYGQASGISGRNKQRILNHASQCNFIPSDLRARVAQELQEKSLSKQVEDQVKANGGADKGTKTLKQTSIVPHSKRAHSEQLKSRLDLALLKLWTVSGIPYRIADIEEWRDFIKAAAPAYQPPGSTTLREYMVPREAEYLHNTVLENLKKETNLTISFDGSTTRFPESIYTIHVTTPSREVYLIKGHEASAESHTAEHIATAVIEVMESIGSNNFALVVADDAGNTKGARKIIQAKYPWIFNTPDPCHRLSNTVRTIVDIPCFKQTIKVIRRTIKFFSNSTFGKTAFNRIKSRYPACHRGLVSIGKTRFATIFHSAESLKRCLPVIYDVVRQEIHIPDVHEHFIAGTRAAFNFEADLTILCAILTPIARAITCLESSHTTVADVFIFWLAVMATYEELLSGPQANDLDDDIREKIRRILNFRFNQMIEDGPTDIYVTGFFLHPRYRDSKILKQSRINPLSTGAISIRDGKAMHAKNDLYHRVGEFLTNQLRIEYQDKKNPLNNLSAKEALIQLRAEFHSYASSEYPFNHPISHSMSPREWWTRLLPHPHASVLAYFGVKMFSVMCNSMVEERAVSKISQLNTPLRNRFKAASLIRTIQLRDGFIRSRNAGKTSSPAYIPTTKFYNIEEKASKVGTKRKHKGIENESNENSAEKADDDGTDENGGDPLADMEGLDIEEIPDPAMPTDTDLEAERGDKLVYSQFTDSFATTKLLDYLSDARTSQLDEFDTDLVQRNSVKDLTDSEEVSWTFSTDS